MKCPKCKYTTFDYLDSCPRCGKDFVAEKTKLNIVSFRPDPLFLLGSLTGDLSESSFSFKALKPTKEGGETKLKPDEVYDDGSDLEITLDQKPPSETVSNGEGKTDDLNIFSDEKEIELDFSSDDSISEIEKKIAEAEGINKEKAGQDDQEIEIESGDLKLNLDLDEEEETEK